MKQTNPSIQYGQPMKGNGMEIALKFSKWVAVAAAAALIAGCGREAGQTGEPKAAQPPAAQASSQQALSLIAGSELKDIEPLMAQVKQETGIDVKLSYAGSIDAAERMASDQSLDGAWLASGRYALLLPAAKARVVQSNKTMLSPVVLGMRESKARELGWTKPGAEPTWAQIAKAAESGKFTFGMTSPTASNTGFSALLGLATALSGKGEAVEAKDVNAKALAGFFKAQKLTSGSSGWLMDAFVAQQGKIDAVVNYAPSIEQLNQSGKFSEKLFLIYPKDGVATADYPLILMNKQKQDSYQKVVDYVRGKAFQEAMSARTLRRPVNTEAKASDLSPKLGDSELPFPGKLETVDAILASFDDEIRLPTDSTFVVDISGSMGGSRIEALRQSLLGLVGGDADSGSKFAKFRNRERVTLIPFDDRVDPFETVDLGIGAQSNGAGREAMAAKVKSLQARGGTAIYEAARVGYQSAAARRAKDPARFYSIVVMTDGENNQGIDAKGFEAWYRSLPEKDMAIKIFAIQFGEARSGELQVLADATGGKVFDSRKTPLQAIFKEIRGYQ